MTESEVQETRNQRPSKRAVLVFAAITMPFLIAQFLLEALGRGMGLSCNLEGVVTNLPAFISFTGVLAFLGLIYWGASRATRAIAYAASLHIMNAGLFAVLIEPGCYTLDNPPWYHRDPVQAGWILIAFGAAIFAIVRLAAFWSRGRSVVPPSP